MIIIDTYTAKYDAACRHQPRLRAGMLVAIAESCDDREADGFRRHIRSIGLDVGEFVRWQPRAKRNVHRLSRA